jgi:hypothetical protein
MRMDRLTIAAVAVGFVTCSDPGARPIDEPGFGDHVTIGDEDFGNDTDESMPSDADGTIVDFDIVHSPIVTAVDGNGPVDLGAGFGPHHMADGLIIQGEYLLGASVSLHNAQGEWQLVFRVSSDTLLEVALPSTIAPGSYVLVVENPLGSAQFPIYLLEGPQGEPCP